MRERPPAAVVVRNTASHDARVLRCARTLRSLGYEPVVLAVTSEQETEARAVVQGVPIVRLAPQAPLPGLRRALRRSASRRANGRTPRLGAQADLRRGSPDGLSAPARVYRLLRTLSYYRRGIAAMRALRPRVVHCNDYNTMWIGVAAKLLTGCALVYDSHELWPDRNGRSEPRWWLLACETLFLRVADATLSTSPGHAEAIARRYRVQPPRVVRNVAERAAAAAPAPAGEGALARTIVYVGALTSCRGLEEAIAALPNAPDTTLRILGPGSDSHRGLLAALAAEHGVAARVRIERAVPPQLVVGSVAGATAGLALIQPCCLSYALSLPNKLFEYLAAGLPILAADVPVIRDFVERNRVGLVAPPDDPAAIAAAMLQIVDPDRNRRLRAAVREATAELSWEREVERLKRAYLDVTAAPASNAAMPAGRR